MPASAAGARQSVGRAAHLAALYRHVEKVSGLRVGWRDA
jgi:hypothetical protein